MVIWIRPTTLEWSQRRNERRTRVPAIVGGRDLALGVLERGWREDGRMRTGMQHVYGGGGVCSRSESRCEYGTTYGNEGESFVSVGSWMLTHLCRFESVPPVRAFVRAWDAGCSWCAHACRSPSVGRTALLGLPFRRHAVHPTLNPPRRVQTDSPSTRATALWILEAGSKQLVSPSRYLHSHPTQFEPIIPKCVYIYAVYCCVNRVNS